MKRNLILSLAMLAISVSSLSFANEAKASDNSSLGHQSSTQNSDQQQKKKHKKEKKQRKEEQQQDNNGFSIYG